MILNCNFEELRALSSGADVLLEARGSRAALPERILAEVEAMRPRLTGDIEVDTVAEQQGLRTAVAAVTGSLRDRMNAMVLDHHPGYEEAVLLYFEYAHALTLLRRLDGIGAELSALEDLMNVVQV